MNGRPVQAAGEGGGERRIYKRAPYIRLTSIELKEADLLTRRLLLSNVVPKYCITPEPPKSLARAYTFLNGDGFASLHPAVNPASRGIAGTGTAYGVPGSRAERKRIQIANIIAALCTLVQSLRDGGRVFIDMCGGCGHVGLVFAALFPAWKVYIADVKGTALAIAEKRAKEAGLKNVSTVQGDIVNIQQRFDIACALHACGGASDAVLAKAMKLRACVVIASCCVGGIVSKKESVTGNGRKVMVENPAENDEPIDWINARSKRYKALLNSGEYTCLAKAADYGEWEAGQDEWRRISKALIENDRAEWLHSAGYETRLVKMKPVSCTPKNDILVAWPSSLAMRAEWEEDSVMNTIIKAHSRSDTAISSFTAEEITRVERKIRQKVLDPSSSGQYKFPSGLGSRQRKLVHTVAASLQLTHVSSGRGRNRHVCVQRSMYWPLYHSYYIGIGGRAVDNVAKAFGEHVPQNAIADREVIRGRAHHVTIVGPWEMESVPEQYSNIEKLLEFIHTKVKNTHMTALGVGKREKQAEQKRVTYFAPVVWPAAQKARSALGLEEAQFHITLGFLGTDVHGVDKSADALFVREQHIIRPWADDDDIALEKCC